MHPRLLIPRWRLKWAAAFLLFVTSAAVGQTQADFDEVAFRGIREMEVGNPTSYKPVPIYVLDAAAGDQARRALLKYRTVVDTVPEDAKYILPKGYIHVRALQVTGDTAKFEATSGPIPRGAMLNCGETQEMEFHRIDGEWIGGVGTITVC
jgi:hypothetical protein